MKWLCRGLWINVCYFISSGRKTHPTTSILQTELAVLVCFRGRIWDFFSSSPNYFCIFSHQVVIFREKAPISSWRMGKTRKLAKDILQLLLLLGKRKGKRGTICSTIKKICSGSNDRLGLNALQRVSFKVIPQNKFSYFTYIFSTKTSITISKSKNKIAIFQYKHWHTSQ